MLGAISSEEEECAQRTDLTCCVPLVYSVLGFFLGLKTRMQIKRLTAKKFTN